LPVQSEACRHVKDQNRLEAQVDDARTKLMKSWERPASYSKGARNEGTRGVPWRSTAGFRRAALLARKRYRARWHIEIETGRDSKGQGRIG